MHPINPVTASQTQPSAVFHTCHAPDGSFSFSDLAFHGCKIRDSNLFGNLDFNLSGFQPWGLWHPGWAFGDYGRHWIYTHQNSVCLF